MARYYFHVQSGNTVHPDDEGSDLPSLSAAQEQALASARELLADAIKFGKLEVPICIVIAAEDGRELAKIPVKDILPPELC
jgi:hypothetical protein